MTELLAHTSSSGYQEQPFERHELEFSTQLVKDIVPGISCRVHWVNKDESNDLPPVNVLFGFGTDINSTQGKDYVTSIWDHLDDRQGISLEMEKRAANLDEQTKWAWEVFDRLGIPTIDIMSMSTGGAKAMHLAGSAHGRVNNLVAASSVGTLKGGARAYTQLVAESSINMIAGGVKKTALAVPGLFRSNGSQELETSSLIDSTKEAFGSAIGWGGWLGNCMRNASRSKSDLQIIFNSNMQEAIQKLDGLTRLSMIVGNKDPFSNDEGARRAIETYKNFAGADKAQLTVMNGMGHNWTPQQDMLGRLAGAALRGAALPEVIDLTQPAVVSQTLRLYAPMGTTAFAG